MFTEEQEWSQRFSKHIENTEEEEDYSMDNRQIDLGPEYKVR